jgi:hypothetical protein
VVRFRRPFALRKKSLPHSPVFHPKFPVAGTIADDAHPGSQRMMPKNHSGVALGPRRPSGFGPDFET